MARKKTGHIRKMLKAEQANMAKLPKSQQAEYEKLWKQYAKEAKLADQALRRLEGLSHHEHFKNVRKFAYAKAMKDIERWSGKGKKRFDTAAPKTLTALKNKLADIRNFMSSTTSSKKKIQQTYQKRVDTLNKNHGTNFTWQEMANFWESQQMDKLSALGQNSDIIIMAIGTMKKLGPKKGADQLRQISESKIKRMAPDEVVANKVQILIDQGYSYHDIIYGGMLSS